MGPTSPSRDTTAPTGDDSSPAPAAPVRHAAQPSGTWRAVRAGLGRLRRRLRAFRDGTLHPWRRRRALRRLAEGPSPRSVLFLCLGNVCRSPYAEYRFRDWLSNHHVREVDVRSAGFIGPGRSADETAMAIARTHGVDTSAHRSILVDWEMVERADLVVLVDPAHGRRLRDLLGDRPQTPTVVLGDLDPEPIRSRRIRDPWGEDPAVFERVFARLDRCLDVLAEAALPSGGRE